MDVYLAKNAAEREELKKRKALQGASANNLHEYRCDTRQLCPFRQLCILMFVFCTCPVLGAFLLTCSTGSLEDYGLSKAGVKLAFQDYIDKFDLSASRTL